MNRNEITTLLNELAQSKEPENDSYQTEERIIEIEQLRKKEIYTIKAVRLA